MRTLCDVVKLRARRAFSLAELIVVLALLGITAGLAAPALLSVTRDDDHESVRAVRTLLEDAHAAALAGATRVELVIDSADARFWLTIGNDSARQGAVPLADGTRIELSRARAHFVWNVGAAAAGDTIVVVTPTSRTRFTLDPWTGAVLHGQ